MASKTRKVSFYRLSLEKRIHVSGHREAQAIQLSTAEIEKEFKRIYDKKMQKISNGSRAVNVDLGNNKYVFEVANYRDHRAFIKIGQQNPANTVALRDRETLESSAVPMSESQLLELFTFCLVDFETCIVSYIGINGAPRVSAIRNLFNQNLSDEENASASLAAIMTKDVLEILMQKKLISKISVTVAVPEDQILSDIGLNAGEFDALRNVKTKTATFNIVGKKNKNLFESGTGFAELIQSIKSKYGEKLLGLHVNARNVNEKSQAYDLLQYNFTKTVVLGQDDDSLLRLSDFEDALIRTYRQYKIELLEYSRV